MAYRQKKPNDYLAPNLVKQIFTALGAGLVSIGRPFYLFCSYLLITLFFISYITGYLTRTTVTLLLAKLPAFALKLTRKKISTAKIKSYFWKASLSFITIIAHLFALLIKFIFAFFGALIKLSKKSSKLLELLRKKVSRLPKPSFRLRIPKLKFLVTVLAVAFFAGSIASYILWTTFLHDLPRPEDLITRSQEVSTKIYDRNGKLLYTIFKDQNRTPVPLDRIPAQVRLATIAIEDAEFYNHPGFSIRGIIRAILRNVQRGELAGGSTITQQLVKNALLTPEKTLERKIREIILAIQVELAFDKNEILEMYLNEVAYGGTAYGIQQAAKSYFDKDVDKLTLAEAALLAGLPKSPTRFSPFGASPEMARLRQKEVLKLMKINGFITEEQRVSSEEEKLTFATNISNIRAPHFVMYVRQALVDSYGEELVAKGGLEVTTTLDLRIQELAEKIVKEEVEKLTGLNVGNGAALVLDTQTGDILAMVGSKDYFDIEAEGNVNLTTSLRQPGSSIKVVNYAYALENGYSPATILEDTPKTFNVEGLPPYTPKNYDGKFRGKLPLRNAFAESRNVPAVKVLDSYGVINMIEQGRKMGITTWNNPSDYGLSLTLGGGEIRLIDLAQVYTTIANYGTRPEISHTLIVVSTEGEVLEKRGCQDKDSESFIVNVSATESALKIAGAEKESCLSEQVLDSRVAYMLIDILRDNQARSPAFGSNSLLVIPGHPEVAVKTGTSNDLRDNLTIGFNHKYLVAVWVGNNDNSPMGRVASGITGATPIWHKIMSALLSNEKSASRRNDWQIPAGLIQLPICTLTDSLACEGCFTAMEWFMEENQPTQACNPEYIKYVKELKEEELFRLEGFQPEEAFSPEGEILPEASSTER